MESKELIEIIESKESIKFMEFIESIESELNIKYEYKPLMHC